VIQAELSMIGFTMFFSPEFLGKKLFLGSSSLTYFYLDFGEIIWDFFAKIVSFAETIFKE
jgi:hypothetical protein